MRECNSIWNNVPSDCGLAGGMIVLINWNENINQKTNKKYGI